MENNFLSKKIKISELFLWDKNARFPDSYLNNDEKELINYFLTRQDFKIKQLVSEIVKDFDLPQLEKLIVWNDGKRNIVLEGNRRIAANKLLINPELSTNKALRQYFEEQKILINITNNLSIDCLVTTNKNEGLRYIDRKHLNGNNEVNWQDTERAHYSTRRGSNAQTELLKIGLSKIIKDVDLPSIFKDKILGRGFETTFYRVLTSKPAKNIFGYKFNSKGELTIEDIRFKDYLKIIITDIIRKQTLKGEIIDSRTLNKTDKIEKYIYSIKLSDVKKVDSFIKENTTKNIFGDTIFEINSSKKILPKSSQRNYLIPSSCRLIIYETKINNIYRELRNDLILNDTTKAVPNAVGVLFRVFLEISIDYFLEKYGITLKKDTKLSGKITICAQKMEEKGIANSNQLINIRKVASDKNNLLNIQYFHDYVHSYKTQPSTSDLKLKWDNLQEFFELLWNNLLTIENKAKLK